jgi:hypothetical protein
MSGETTSMKRFASQLQQLSKQVRGTQDAQGALAQPSARPQR